MVTNGHYSCAWRCGQRWARRAAPTLATSTSSRRVGGTVPGRRLRLRRRPGVPPTRPFIGCCPIPTCGSSSGVTAGLMVLPWSTHRGASSPGPLQSRGHPRPFSAWARSTPGTTSSTPWLSLAARSGASSSAWRPSARCSPTRASMPAPSCQVWPALPSPFSGRPRSRSVSCLLCCSARTLRSSHATPAGSAASSWPCTSWSMPPLSRVDALNPAQPSPSAVSRPAPGTPCGCTSPLAARHAARRRDLRLAARLRRRDLCQAQPPERQALHLPLRLRAATDSVIGPDAREAAANQRGRQRPPRAS